MNEYRNAVSGTDREELFNTVSNNDSRFSLCVQCGYRDTRESPAIYVSNLLMGEQASLAIYDPKAIENAKTDLAGVPGKVEFFEDPYEAAKGAHAIAVITDWKEFASYDYEKIFSLMEKPAFLFDGRNILDHKKLFSIGFNVFPLGKRDLTHF